MRSVSLTYIYIITDISLFYKGFRRNLKIFHLFYKIILYNKSKFYVGRQSGRNGKSCAKYIKLVMEYIFCRIGI